MFVVSLVVVSEKLLKLIVNYFCHSSFSLSAYENEITIFHLNLADMCVCVSFTWFGR